MKLNLPRATPPLGALMIVVLLTFPRLVNDAGGSWPSGMMML